MRDLHFGAVVAFAVEANSGSRRVMEKVGMIYGSHFDHPSIPELESLRRHAHDSPNVLTGTKSPHHFASW